MVARDEVDILNSLNEMFSEEDFAKDFVIEDVNESVLKIIKEEDEMKKQVIETNKLVASGIDNLKNRERVSDRSGSGSSSRSGPWGSSSSSSSGNPWNRGVYQEREKTVEEVVRSEFEKLRERAYKEAEVEDKVAKAKYKSTNPQIEVLMGRKKKKKRGIKESFAPGTKGRKVILVAGIVGLKAVTMVLYDMKKERKR